MEGGDKDKSAYSCGSCGSSLKADHLGIRCKQGHDLCQECAKMYVENILSEPESKIPPKCSFCNCELSSASVEMQMTSEQLSVYLMYMSMKQVDDNEQIVNCPFCKYFEIWSKHCTSNFFYCKKEG